MNIRYNHTTGEKVITLVDYKIVGGRDHVRELVRIRDNHTCQSCGRVWREGERRFDVHHLKGLCGLKSRKCDKKSEIDELITLCHKCHYSQNDYRGGKKNDYRKKVVHTF